MRRKCSSHLSRDERPRGPFYRSTRRLLILMILTFLLSSTINNYRSLEEATPLSPFAAEVDSTNPPVVPEKQYWGTFYYPWYGRWQFQRDPTAPLLLGHTEPEVIKVGTTYYLYYRTDSSIGFASSTDGLQWNDLSVVLTPSPSGWDSGEVIAPSVISESGTLYLFYEAEDSSDPGHRAIGLATSTSPTGPFTKHLDNPVLAPTESWEGTIVGTPVVAKVGTRFYMFYHGFSGGSDRGGVAYSSDLVLWTKEPNNPILDIGPTGSWDDTKAAPSSANVSSPLIWLFYEGYDGAHWRIGVASGIVNQTDQRIKSLTKDPSPILDLGPQGAFDDETVQLPSLIYTRTQYGIYQYWMYYSGNDGTAFRLGRAVADSSDTLRHWKNDRHNPPYTWASMYLPDDGSGVYNTANLYSSRDIIVIDRHLAWMDYANLDFALVSWWGQDSFEDKAFRLMLDRAQLNQSLRLKLAIYYEREGPDFAQQPTVEEIVNDLTYIYNSKSNFTSYFRTGPDNYPVIFVYGDDGDGVEYTDRWSQARDIMYAKGKPVFIVLKVFPGYDSNSNDKKVDGWHQYAPANPREQHGSYSAYVSPGFLPYPEIAGSRPSSFSRNATWFARNVTWLASLNVAFRLVETFNEWHEGTQIEPEIPINHMESGFTQSDSSYGFTYIDIIRYRGQPPDFTISASPSSLSIVAGSSSTSTITLTSLNGFAGTATLAATVYLGNTPVASPRVSLDNPTVKLSTDRTNISIITIYTTHDTPLGTYVITTTGTSGSLSGTLTISVDVTSPPLPPDFHIFGLEPARFYAILMILAAIVAIVALVAFARWKRKAP